MLVIEYVLRILGRSAPVFVILLISIAVDSLNTWGNDLELTVFNFSPLLSLLLNNIQVLNIKFRLLYYSGKPMFRWFLYGILHILIIYLVFVRLMAFMMPILEEHEYSKALTYRFSFYITKLKPVVTVATFRYPGEDVEFRCKSHIGDQYRHMWTHDDVTVTESWRHKIGTAHEPENITTFSITLIEEDDYGVYSCWLYDNMNQNVSKFKTKEFILLKRNFQEFESQIPLLGLFTTLVSYSSQEEDDEIEFIHMVDGQEKSSLCSAKDSSYIFYIYRRLQKLQYTDSQIRYVRDKDVTAFHTMISMCPLAFGAHTFSVFRHIYNASSMRWILAEIDIPMKVFITPKRSPFLAYFTNGTNSSKYLSGSVDFLADQAIFFHSLEVVFICVLIIVCIMFTSKLINIIIDPFFNATLNNFVNKWIVRYFYGKGEKDITPVYLACEETGAPWCNRVLSPVFESLGHGTFIPLRDSRPGQSELGGIMEGMERCSRYVIVIKEREKEASPLWKHQVELILDRLVRGELTEYNILIVSINHASYSPIDNVRKVKNIACVELCKYIPPGDRSLNGVIRWLLSSKANLLLQY